MVVEAEVAPIDEVSPEPEPAEEDVEEFRDNLRDLFDTAASEAVDIPLEAVPYRPDRTPEPEATKDDEYRDEYIDWSLVELPRKAAGVDSEPEPVVAEIEPEIEPATPFADIIDELSAPTDAPRFEIESVEPTIEPTIEAVVDQPAAPELVYLEDDEPESDEAQDVPDVEPLDLDDLDVDSYASPALYDRAAPSFDEQAAPAAPVNAWEPEPEREAEPEEAQQHTSSAANDIAREIAALEEAYETAHAEPSWLQPGTTGPDYQSHYDAGSFGSPVVESFVEEEAPAAPAKRPRQGRRSPQGTERPGLEENRIAPREEDQRAARTAHARAAVGRTGLCSRSATGHHGDPREPHRRRV